MTYTKLGTKVTMLSINKKLKAYFWFHLFRLCLSLQRPPLDVWRDNAYKIFASSLLCQDFLSLQLKIVLKRSNWLNGPQRIQVLNLRLALDHPLQNASSIKNKLSRTWNSNASLLVKFYNYPSKDYKSIIIGYIKMK